MTVVTDNFDRGDGALGANWNADSGAWAIASQTVRQSTSGGSYRKCRWIGAALSGSDNYCQATCASNVNWNGVGVFVRGSVDTNVTYYAQYFAASDSDYLVELSAGTDSVLDTGSLRSAGAYTLRIEANGSSLTGYFAGSASTSATDATLASGSPGMMTYDSVNDASNYLDNWEAGDLGAPAGASVRADYLNFPRRVLRPERDAVQTYGRR